MPSSLPLFGQAWRWQPEAGSARRWMNRCRRHAVIFLLTGISPRLTTPRAFFFAENGRPHCRHVIVTPPLTGFNRGHFFFFFFLLITIMPVSHRIDDTYIFLLSSSQPSRRRGVCSLLLLPLRHDEDSVNITPCLLTLIAP